jgi:hypothetical protein
MESAMGTEGKTKGTTGQGDDNPPVLASELASGGGDTANETGGKPSTQTNPGAATTPPPAPASVPSAKGTSPKQRTPVHPPTACQKFWAAAGLVLAVAATLLAGRVAVERVDTYIQRENHAPWKAPAGVQINPGPPAFRYDAENGQLLHIGVISAERKAELLALFPHKQGGSLAATGGYSAAVDQLAFGSNKDLRGLLVWVLVLGGLAGSLGAQLRSLVNFVGHACYTQALDLVVWWPYYLVRPFTGFVLGTVIVTIVEGGLLLVTGSATNGAMWWAGIAFLAGYGENEFTQKLRQLTKTLFGSNEPR